MWCRVGNTVNRDKYSCRNGIMVCVCREVEFPEVFSLFRQPICRAYSLRSLSLDMDRKEPCVPVPPRS